MNAIETIRKNPQMYIEGDFDHDKVHDLLEEESNRGGGEIHFTHIKDDLIFIAGSGWADYRWDEIRSIEGEVNSMHNEVIIAALCKEFCFGSVSISEYVEETLGVHVFKSKKAKEASFCLYDRAEMFHLESNTVFDCAQNLDVGQYSFVLVRI